MPGFYVSDGAFKNTKAPNPACCSDPKVLCRNCAKLVLASPPSKYFNLQDSLDGTVRNSMDDDLLLLPGPLVNCRRDDDIYGGADATDNLPLPVIVPRPGR